MIELSERLRLIKSLVPQGSKVCDVGTDHGYLPAALVSDGWVNSVIATDLREKPLRNAQENLERLGISGVDLRLCDGLSLVSAKEVDTVIVAGMGGEVIAGILERAPWLKARGITLILQAMTSAEALRDYLAESGFYIEKEPTLEENGKVYSVILARFDGAVRRISPAFRYVGAVNNVTASDKRYIQKQYIRLNNCAESLKGIETQCERYNEYKAAAEQLRQLTEE